MGYSSKREKCYARAMDMYFNQGVPGTHICRILSISSSALYNWVAKFVAENSQNGPVMKKKIIANGKSTAEQPALPDPALTKENQALQAEIKRLQAQLTEAEIKVEAYDELINVAEAKFNIQIRKKAGAKQ